MPFNVIPFIFQYSLFSKKESGHEDAIWSCAWGQKKGSNKEKIGQNDEDQNDEDQNETGPNFDHPEQIVVTGGVDDLVKIWAYDDGALSLRHKLADHSLGVVSVALSKEAECKKGTSNFYFYFLN